MIERGNLGGWECNAPTGVHRAGGCHEKRRMMTDEKDDCPGCDEQDSIVDTWATSSSVKVARKTVSMVTCRVEMRYGYTYLTRPTLFQLFM